MKEQTKKKRGRPKIDAGLTSNGASSRRQAVNRKYMFDGICLITVAAAEIPDVEAIWYSDDETRTAKCKNGILEQIGRMQTQDSRPWDECVYITKLAAQAVKAGHHAKEVEIAIRKIRMALKKATDAPDDPALANEMEAAVYTLATMR